MDPPTMHVMATTNAHLVALLQTHQAQQWLQARLQSPPRAAQTRRATP